MEHTEENLLKLIGSVSGPDTNAMDDAEKRQAQLAKPPGSLGMLEELSVRMAGITGRVYNRIEKKRLIVFASDNGVVSEGVASAPQSVTTLLTVGLCNGKTGAAVLARSTGCELVVCDVGVNADIPEKKVVGRKIAYGTGNIAAGPAMTREQAVRAVMTGIELAVSAAKEGCDVIGVGEVGIGNTTTSSAVLSVLTGTDAEKVTGKGAGLTGETYLKKIGVIRKAIEINRPDGNDPLDVISKVGGFDIAAMAGAFIGAAVMRIPAVIDGFISVVAALCAYRLCPAVRDYMFPSHESFEIGYRTAVGELKLRPMFSLGMRLGEGSGCPLAFEFLSEACAVIDEMATFEELNITDEYLDNISGGDSFSVK